ncbi:MAG: C25 family cysteine peptidase, partial [Deltaproteobacteria bacterium]
AGAQGTYLVVSGNGAKSPVAISEDNPSTLSDDQNGADYIVITHRELGWDGAGVAQSWLTELLALRENQGLRVMAVDIEDIYDEFSYGLSTPRAVKDFLSYAYQNWTSPSPRYVLLVGDGTFDPKDHMATGATSFITPYLTATEHMGETVSEDWLVRVSGDDAMADLFIGRLPASSLEEADLMVQKILSYETSGNTKDDWEKTVLLISDNQTEDFEAAFEEMNETVASLVPAGFSSPIRGYLGDYCPVVETCSAAPLTTDLSGWITSGALIVHYSGHGSTQIWADEHIFDTDDVSALTNPANEEILPFFVSMSCLTGYFAYPEVFNFPSLAEELLLASDKGAVAAFMPSGMTTTEGQKILDRALFDAIFTQDMRTLGEAIAHAKETLLSQGSQYEEVAGTFLLFGDPAMTLKVPLPHRPEGFSAQRTTTGVTLSWNGATDCNGDPVASYNLYRSTTPGGPYTQANTSPITGTQYDDTPVSATRAQYVSTSAASGGTYYYVVTSVDADGDESVYSQEVTNSTQSTTSGTSESSGGGGGGGCFINTVAGK